MKEKTSPTQRVLNLWAIILIIWSIYRASFKTDLPPWFDEFVAKPAIFVFPVFWFIKKVEKKNIFRSMDWQLKSLPGDLAFGGMVGILFLLVGYGTALMRSVKTVPTLPFSAFGTMLMIALATSISEEILSRGFVLKRLSQESRNLFYSIGLSSLLFFILHIPILFTSPQVNGMILLQVMVTDMLLSVAISLLYLERKSLTLAIIIHLFYALSLSLFL